jgi:two-component system sensor kinase FixL
MGRGRNSARAQVLQTGRCSIVAEIPASRPTGLKAKEGPAPPVDRDLVHKLVEELSAREPAARLLRSSPTDVRAADLSHVGCILAHELRQPLFTIDMANENVRLMIEDPEADRDRIRQSLARIAEQVQRAQAIIKQTLASVSGPPEEQERADLGEAARTAAELTQLLPYGEEVDLECEPPHEPMLVGVGRLELEQVFINLLRNAIESIADRRRSGWLGRGKVSIAMRHCGGDVRCVIVDNGAGVSQASSKAVFRPFYTTKAAHGTGLGLHICRHIVSKAGGVIHLHARRVEGAQVEFRLPRVS